MSKFVCFGNSIAGIIGGVAGIYILQAVNILQYLRISFGPAMKELERGLNPLERLVKKHKLKQPSF